MCLTFIWPWCCSPYIIGTMNQATCSTTNLQLHHNFRWVLCANHMEPVKGFLGRYLRRKLIESEVTLGTRNSELNKIVDWMPKVWQHLNKFLETHSSSDVTIGKCCLSAEIWVFFNLINPSRLGDIYRSKWIGSSLFQVMAWHLFGTKPLPEHGPSGKKCEISM